MGWRYALTKLHNYLDFALIIIVIWTFTLHVLESSGREPKNPKFLNLLEVIGVFLFSIEGFYILRIFDFYASFARSVIDTIKDSTPILSVFFIVNMVMACLFYLLDKIITETTNEEYC